VIVAPIGWPAELRALSFGSLPQFRQLLAPFVRKGCGSIPNALRQVLNVAMAAPGKYIEIDPPQLAILVNQGLGGSGPILFDVAQMHGSYPKSVGGLSLRQPERFPQITSRIPQSYSQGSGLSLVGFGSLRVHQSPQSTVVHMLLGKTVTRQQLM
jgi:hypothetical protein